MIALFRPDAIPLRRWKYEHRESAFPFITAVNDFIGRVASHFFADERKEGVRASSQTFPTLDSCPKPPHFPIQRYPRKFALCSLRWISKESNPCVNVAEEASTPGHSAKKDSMHRSSLRLRRPTPRPILQSQFASSFFASRAHGQCKHTVRIIDKQPSPRKLP